MPKTKELTIRERKLIKGVLSGLSVSEAARRAGYSPRSAGSIGSETLKKPDVRESMLKAMKDAGITMDTLATTMKEGLQANRVVSARVIHSKPTENGEQEADTRTDDFVEVPDHATRHKFFESGLDIVGAKAPREAKINVAGMEELLGLLDDDDEEPGEA